MKRCFKCFGVGYLNIEKLNLPKNINIFDTEKVAEYIKETNNTDVIICNFCNGTGNIEFSLNDYVKNLADNLNL